MNLANQRVAVTGAAGFIGSHLLHALHGAGAEIVALLPTGAVTPLLDALPFPVERMFYADEDGIGSGLGEAVRRAAPRAVVHLAAVISTERSLQVLLKTVQANVLATIGLLTACTELGVERVILMGSCEEYGQKRTPFDPEAAPDPNSPYGASKAAATAYARMFYGNFHLPTVVLRPSVVYGPSQAPRMLIPMVMQALAANQPIDVTEGRQTRDFIYVSDVIEAILIALRSPGLAGEAWNVGSGEIVTVRECIEMMERVTGRTGLVRYGGRPYVEREIFHYEPVIEKTTAAFGWQPSVMLEEGLRRTWKALRAE